MGKKTCKQISEACFGFIWWQIKFQFTLFTIVLEHLCDESWLSRRILFDSAMSSSDDSVSPSCNHWSSCDRRNAYDLQIESFCFCTVSLSILHISTGKFSFETVSIFCVQWTDRVFLLKMTRLSFSWLNFIHVSVSFDNLFVLLPVRC